MVGPDPPAWVGHVTSGDLKKAESAFPDALAATQRAGDKPFLAESSCNLAGVHAEAGRGERLYSHLVGSDLHLVGSDL